MNVLIVAKTRRKDGGPCIGAISEDGQSLRLENAAIGGVGGGNDEYSVGDEWEILKYEPATNTIPPHVENIIVYSKRQVSTNQDCLPRIIEAMPPICGGPEALYEGLLWRTRNGSLYVADQSHLPSFSTMFWRPDKPLQLDSTSGKRLRYRYADDNGGCTLTFVGYQEAVQEIPAGAIVRVSLAHWWRSKDKPDDELRCYVQLSGWFESIESIPSGPGPGGTTVDELEHMLKEHFGYDEFRPPQKEIINSLTQGEDAFLIMPTGGGKSLCYQLTAIAMEGVSVVVSPLISLMADQVDALNERGISAAYLNSTLDYGDYIQRQQQVRNNQIRLLYVAPETLVREEIIVMLQQSKMTLLAIDEAHCISEWGPDFRPEYRQLGDIRKRLLNVPCIALTATATPRVQKEIVESLHISPEQTYIGDLDRENLFLSVANRDKGATKQVFDFIQQHKGQSGIVYCTARATVNDLCAELQERGVSALPYHAGLENSIREENQHKFIRDDVDVIVATIAFGMGIDKSNVRFVLHYNLPDSLDKYYQQIGRAGRDGVRSDCLLLFDSADIRTLRYFITQMSQSERLGAEYRLNQIVRWAENSVCRRKPLLKYFGQDYDADNCEMCDVCTTTEESDTGKDDLSEHARLFLQCVKTTGERFGKAHIIRILYGSTAKNILKWHHDKLDIYGKGNYFKIRQWRQLANQFLDRGLVVVGDYRVLSITEAGKQVLAGESFYGTLPTKPEDPKPGYDPLLFERLRVLRRSIATELGLLPFHVFHDSVLKEMAVEVPVTLNDLRRIRGVGPTKSDQYGEQFLLVIREYLDTKGSKPDGGDDQPPDYDVDLFNKLRAHRKSTADSANLAPHVIFDDQSLIIMAKEYPTTYAQFRDIRGVGDYKTNRYGRQFLYVIRQHLEIQGIDADSRQEDIGDDTIIDDDDDKLTERAKNVVSCYLETLSIAAAAQRYDVPPINIVLHLERYVEAGHDLSLESIVAESNIEARDRHLVFKMLAEGKPDSIESIHDHFDGRISYYELRLLLLWFKISSGRIGQTIA